jgi:hypothetical protein
MKRPSKKEIKAAIDKLKDKPAGSTSSDHTVNELPSKKSNQRIRKQGI